MSRARAAFVVACAALLACAAAAAAGSVQPTPEAQSDRITSLPGLAAPLPFDMFSGYITVDPDHGRALFYWFVESAGDPAKDPILVWMQGGPGCSSLIGYEWVAGPRGGGRGARQRFGVPRPALHPRRLRVTPLLPPCVRVPRGTPAQAAHGERAAASPRDWRCQGTRLWPWLASWRCFFGGLCRRPTLPATLPSRWCLVVSCAAQPNPYSWNRFASTLYGELGGWAQTRSAGPRLVPAAWWPPPGASVC